MVEKQLSIAVIGAGSWGTALAKLLGDKGYHVHLWAHNEDHATRLNSEHENKKYLAGFSLADNVKVSSGLEHVIEGKDFILMVVPSHVYRDVFSRIVPLLVPKSIVVSATKGIENESLMTMSQVMADVLKKEEKEAEIGVLTGPSFAKEVAAGIPTAVTVAAQKRKLYQQFKTFFSQNDSGSMPAAI